MSVPAHFVFYAAVIFLLFGTRLIAQFAVQSCHVYLHHYNATACVRASEHATELMHVKLSDAVKMENVFSGEKPDSFSRGLLVRN